MSARSTTKTDAVPAEVSAPLFDVDAVAAYKGSTDRKAKAAIRKAVSDCMLGAIDELNLTKAAYFKATLAELTSDAKASAESVPVEVTVARRIFALRHAANLLADGEVRPAGVESIDLAAMTTAYEALVLVDEHEEELVAAATKLASAKLTRSADRHSIGDAIARAFDSVQAEEGHEMKISEVSRKGAIEGYTPSPGAVRAHLESEGAIEGFELFGGPGTGQPFSVRFTG